MIVLSEERAVLRPEARAWAEYLAWTRGADPREYRLTEERAWARLERALIGLRLRHYGARLVPSAPGKALVTVRHTPRLGGGGA